MENGKSGGILREKIVSEEIIVAVLWPYVVAL